MTPREHKGCHCRVLLGALTPFWRCLLPCQWQSLVTNEKCRSVGVICSPIQELNHLLSSDPRLDLSCHVYTEAIFCTQSLAVQPEVCFLPAKFACFPPAIEEEQFHHVVLSELMLQNLTFSRPEFFWLLFLKAEVILQVVHPYSDRKENNFTFEVCLRNGMISALILKNGSVSPTGGILK